MRLAIVGLGLIGGSLLHATSQLRNQCDEKINPDAIKISTIIGIDSDPATRKMAAAHCDAVFPSLSDLPADAMPDMVVLATPVQEFNQLAVECKRLLAASVTITDVGSTKKKLFEAFKEAYGEEPANLVGGHPIAGSEQSGFAAADANLFNGKLIIIVPGKRSLPNHIERVRNIWRSCQSRLYELDPTAHDQLLAYTSHLPHLLAYSLVDYLGQQQDNDDIFRFAAGGFMDFTRIAASNPTMWRDVVMANQQPIVHAINGMIDHLGYLKELIEQADAAQIYAFFYRAKAVRDYFSRTHQASLLTIKSLDLCSHRCKSLQGTINIPGDKSISHRAVMLAALGQGTSQISNLLEGEDNLATIQAFRDMGVVIDGPNDGKVQIEGVGLHGLIEPASPLYMGNSGTAMRLMCGLLAGQKFTSRITGDHSLSGRPMNRIIEPLTQMGAGISGSNQMFAPLRIEPANDLKAINYTLPMPSAQVKSCILFTGLYVKGQTRITEPVATRDHTERMFDAIGVSISRSANTICVDPPKQLGVRNWEIPGDISSAAFFVVAASIIPNSDILLSKVGVNPTRDGVITILKRMGADISYQNETIVGQEPVADIRVRSAQLQGIQIEADLIALAIDEFPILCIAAACANGVTIVEGAQELKVKESDRIAAMVAGLTRLKIDAEAKPDGIKIIGVAGTDGAVGEISGGEVDSFSDHRIAMSFVVAGCVASSPVKVLNCDNIATSFPGFSNLANALGMRIEKV